ncbi:MAG: hypothetical protein ABFS23_11455 [Pseudomonadota bacterium]
MARQISRTRPLTRRIAWSVAILLILLPLLTQAHWIAPPASAAVTTEISCHQTSASPLDGACQHCQDGQPSLGCDCCDPTAPPSLSLEPSLFVTLYRHVGLRQPAATPEPPDPLPASRYRPPIQPLV